MAFNAFPKRYCRSPGAVMKNPSMAGSYVADPANVIGRGSPAPTAFARCRFIRDTCCPASFEQVETHRFGHLEIPSRRRMRAVAVEGRIQQVPAQWILDR